MSSPAGRLADRVELAETRQGRGVVAARVRARVLQEFSLPKMIERYEQTWRAMVADAR